MLILKITRWIFSILKTIERAHIPLLQLIPSKTKQNLVRKIYKPLTSTLPKTVELNGLAFQIPRELDYSYVLYEHEPQTQRLLHQYIREDMIVVDIGANIGYLALLMAQLVGPKGKVYAVEPGPDNLEFLYKNVQLNGFSNVEVLPYAVGATRQIQNFHLRKAGTLHSLYAQADTVVETVRIQVAPLDELVKEKQIDFVKIDVEGGEIEVLKGMRQILQSNPELRLIVEWNPAALQRAGHEAEELPKLLQEAGFHVSVINEETKCLQSLEQVLNHIQASGQHDKSYSNLFAEKSRASL